MNCNFKAASNDGFFNGDCPFATVLNMHNVDDKILPPPLFCIPSAVTWTLLDDKRLSGTLCFNEDTAEDEVGSYVIKDASKVVTNRLSDGDTLLVTWEIYSHKML